MVEYLKQSGMCALRCNRVYSLVLDLCLQSGEWSRGTVQLLIKRIGESLRVVAICLFVTAVAAFPHGRRGGEVPIELVVLGAAFVERGVASLPDISDRFGPLAGTSVLLILSVVVLLYRLRIHRPVWRRVAT